jgi:signal transduction histidine kinase
MSSFIEDTLKKSKVSKQNNIDIQVDLGDLSMSIPLDYHHFQSVLINLLSNAAESITADEGRITIRVSQVDRVVEISVTDNGCGISQEQLKELFAPFKSTKKKGLGIGLYQCKTIVEAHGGKIYVESEVNRGTTFRLELPLVYQELRTI